jgi:transcriptional regulator with XRE-family HTH domain
MGDLQCLSHGKVFYVFCEISLAHFRACVILGMLTMANIKTDFKRQLAEYRKRSGLSYRKLERVTGIKYSALAAMETGNRPVGEQSARRLASAFGLSGEALDTFVLSTLNTSKERILDCVKEYPSEVLNLLGLMLLGQGIKPSHITRCEFNPLAPDCLKLSLKRGGIIHLHVEASGSL